MDALRQWALCLIIAAVACTFVMALSPRGAMDKTIRAVAGIFVVAAICSPLADVFESGLAADAFSLFEYSDSGDEEMKEFILDSYRSEVEKRILEVANEKNVKVIKINISA